MGAALRQLESPGLHVVVEASHHQPAGEAHSHILELVGLDHPGTVRDISHALAARGINVDE